MLSWNGRQMTAETLLAWTPAAIVFDCDGTLMDSERHWEKAREVVLADYGTVCDEEFAGAPRDSTTPNAAA